MPFRRIFHSFRIFLKHEIVALIKEGCTKRAKNYIVAKCHLTLISYPKSLHISPALSYFYSIRIIVQSTTCTIHIGPVKSFNLFKKLKIYESKLKTYEVESL